MNRTVNRQPINIPVPKLKERYFNHLEWKGINSNKNVMGIDQETFAEAENVYISSDNILSSRLPIKQRDKWGLVGEIVNVWTFGEHLTVQTLDDDTYYIWFIHNDELQDVFDNDNNIVEKDTAVILLTRKIFVLNKTQFSAYDIVDNSWLYDAREYIYIPRGDELTEPDNMLIGSSRTTVHHWTQTDTPPWNYFASLDRDIQVRIDGQIHNIKYQRGLEKTFLSKYSDVINNVNGSDIYKARDADTFAFLDGNTLWYSENGINWTDVPFIQPSTKLELKMISHNGDSVWFINTNGDNQNVWVYNISGAGAGNWTYPSNGEFDVTAVAPGYFSCLDADTKDLWIIYYYDPTFANGTDSRKLYYKHPNWSYRSQGNIPSFLFTVPIKSQATVGVATLQGVTYLCANLTFHSILYPGANNSLYCDMTLYNVDSPGNSVTGGTLIQSGDDDMSNPMNVMSKTNSNYISVQERNGVNYILLRGLYLWKYQLYMYEYGWANDARAPTYVSTLQLSSQPSDGDARSILNTDSVITTRRLFLFAPNLPLENTNVTKLDNMYSFPDYLPIANGKLATDYMSRIWAQSADGKTLYVTNANNLITFEVDTIDDINYMYFKHALEWDDVILANGRDTYVAHYKTNDDGVFTWYLKQAFVQNFNFEITGLHILSDTELAVFMPHEIWVTTRHPSTDPLKDTLYTHVRSKLPIGIRQGSEIMTTFDGRFILFSCERGLVALQYQQFVATTEQAITFISDNIQSTYEEFNTGPVRLYQYKYWVVLYRTDVNYFYLLDMRNQSWWMWSFNKPMSALVTYNEFPLSLQHGELYVFGDNGDYTDDGEPIEWKVTSQLLHFDAINNYKQILSFILNSVDTDDKFAFSLQTINYRQTSNLRKKEVFEYNVDTVRQFIKRMQFSKVNEFQYQLKNASDAPLKLTDISIKFIVTERVR